MRTFLQTIQVILAYRDRVGGLLLSELGGYLLSPEQAPAGSKRLSNLLHSPKWDAQVVGDELWQEESRAGAHLAGARRRGAGDLGWQ